jgi:membrane protein DedA with SNARE-associated domain
MEEITSLLAQYGVTLVFANVLLTQIGVPVPAVPMLIVAGALAHEGQLSLPLLLGAAVAASLLGDTPWFVAGRAFGNRAINLLCRVAIEPDSCVKQTENVFERWGAASLVVAKFVPGFAIVAPPIAGAMRLAVTPFFIYSAIGAALWAGVALAIGVLLHAQVDQVLGWLAGRGAWAVPVIGLALGLYIAVKWIERVLLIRFLRTVRISVDELQELMTRPEQPVILDARSAAARRLDPRRIPGARAVDIAAPERRESPRSVKWWCTVLDRTKRARRVSPAC